MTRKKTPDAPTQAPAVVLTDAVSRGNLALLRTVLDNDYLYKGLVPEINWSHLSFALQRKDLPMTRLLLTWGATPDMQALDAMKALQPATYAQCASLLREAGFYGIDTPASAFEAAAKKQANENTAALKLAEDQWVQSSPALSLEKIPHEWLHVLEALQYSGAPEAMIGGGALRDLLNDRPVKDVDIFLSERKMVLTKSFILKAFERSGLTIHGQMVSHGYGTVARKLVQKKVDAFSSIKIVKTRDYWGNAVDVDKRKEGAEGWKIIAGPDRTEYNLVFIKGERGKNIRSAAKKMLRTQAMAQLVSQFDIGICQIACDGNSIFTTEHFQRDMREKRLSMIAENQSSLEHLQRVRAKYSDWMLDAAAEQLLSPTPEEKRRPMLPPPPPTRSVRG